MTSDAQERDDNAAWLGSGRSEKIPDQVARRLLREIRNRSLSAGERLPNEVAMAEEFGVGRASVREALRILETHGLIQIKPGPRGGPIVRSASGADFGRTMSLYFHHSAATYRELIEARLAVEPTQARLAAERLTDEHAELLRDAAEAGWSNLDASDALWVETSRLFHRALGTAGQNRVLELTIGGLLAVEASYISHAVGRGHRPHTLHAHDQIVAAIIDRNAPRAEQLVRDHLQELVKSMEHAYPLQMDEVIAWLNFD